VIRSREQIQAELAQWYSYLARSTALGAVTGGLAAVRTKIQNLEIMLKEHDNARNR
jgi:hypothetical protein